MTHTTTSEVERRNSAKTFAEKWAGRGYEKGDTSSFWLELLRDVVGMQDVTTNVRFEERTEDRGYIDVVINDAKTIIEQKSLGVNLDKPELRQGRQVTPFQQAREYANTLPNNLRPDYIIVSDFGSFRIHDLNKVHAETDYIEFTLAELPEQLYLLDFLIDPQKARAKREEKVSMDAGALIGKLYSALREQYLNPDSQEDQHSLNVLCVRIVFCLFAEDAGVFTKDAFFHYLNGAQPNRVRTMLKDLFEVLNTPEAERDPYLDEKLVSFPYVNGGLFSQETEIPHFTQEILDLLVNEVSQDTNWAEISPTIFGGVFESTLNPETRRSGGMHYTSPENIHKVIDPLFMDDLTAELKEILEAPALGARARNNRLQKFHEKIASLKFFDPAAGSGNFLTETYITLRRMENKILSELANNQTSLGFDEIDMTPLKVSLDQFYGLEINDFAVSVASTALWIAKLQANVEASTIVTSVIEDLPLTDAAHIHQGNALRIDWNEIIPNSNCNYIIGNPPFIGYSRLSAEQKADRLAIFGKPGGVLDYVACWYKKAADFMAGTEIETAFVSTNSICQGQQVTPLWEPLFEAGININFAHRTFIWANEASDAAHVYCIIVGFSYADRKIKVAWTYTREGIDKSYPSHLNGYLADAPDVFITRRTKPLSNVSSMAQGFKPADGGHLLLEPDEAHQLLKDEPEATPWVRRFSMGAEFIKGEDRFCLWLPDITPVELQKLPGIRKRVDACREWRLNQTPTGDAYKLAGRPHLLRPTSKFRNGTYIGIPPVSSERRKYVPIGFVDDGMIPGNQLYFVPTDSRYIFGILTSQFHNAWMRAVAGRLEMRYRYGNTTVYNNFVFPDVGRDGESQVTEKAQAVLDARAKYEGSTLADMYDPDNEFLYPQLTKAHDELDQAVEAAYDVNFLGDEQKIVTHLFELYSETVSLL